MKKKIESYQGAAGGWGAVKSVANAVRKQMDIRQDVIAMFDMNKPEGFDCPGCAWPDPKHSASFDICENGAKAIAWEVTDKQVNASFFAENTVQSLLTWGDHELEAAGRLTQPLKYGDVSDCYKPLSWQQAFDEIGERLQSYSDPNQVEFYTSGRTSNEAAFLYQLFAREYGSNNELWILMHRSSSHNTRKFLEFFLCLLSFIFPFQSIQCLCDQSQGI